MDPDVFEAAMPEAVRAALAQAREGKGPGAAWYASRHGSQTSESFVLLREDVDPVLAGWLAGIAMFDDSTGSIADVANDDAKTEAVAAMIDAFVAGLRASVPPAKRQWQRMELLTRRAGKVPDKLRDELPRALVSTSAVDRGVGLRLVQRCDARGVIELAKAGADGSARKRLDAALASLGGAIQTPAGEPLRARSKTELEVAWLARAAHKEPRDLDVLLGTPWPGAWKAAAARIRALGKFPPDARIAAILPRIRGQHTSWSSSPLRWAIDAIAPKHESAAPAKQVASGNVDELWRELRARPGDIALRAVLGDALQAAGDPRGEYIPLALADAAGTASPAAKKRASQLLAAHIDTWSAGIPGAIRASRRFERGFLTALECKVKAKALLASVDEPAWWTVEELHVQSDLDRDSPAPALEKLLATAPSLQAIILRWWGAEVLDELRGPFPRIRVIGTSGMFEHAWLGAYPSLAMVGMSGRTDVHLARAPNVAILQVFRREPLDEALAAYATNPSVAELRLAPGREIEMVHRGWLVRVRTNDTRATLSWGVGKYVPGSLASDVAALVATGRREIAVAPPSVGRAAVEQEAKSIKGATLEWLREPLATWRV